MTILADTLFSCPARWKSVGDDRIQEHYMIPLDKLKRTELFEEVKKELLKK
jgi:hypothetical protein